MTRYFLNSTTLYILGDDGSLYEAEEIEAPAVDDEVEEDEEEDLTPRKKKKTRKKTTCKYCGELGHTKKTCPKDTVDAPLLGPTGEESLFSVDDEDLAKDIKEMWTIDGKNSLAICNELNITLEQFNRIVIKYKIVKR